MSFVSIFEDKDRKSEFPQIDFVSDKFVNDMVEKFPKPLNEIGEFVYYRTYSRWLEDKGRREYWHETCKRSVNYNFNLQYRHMKKIGLKPNWNKMRSEAEQFFTNQYLTNQFLSGRTLFVGGCEVAEKYPLANFNCSFTTIEEWSDLVELFYLLMIGTGVGFKCTKKMAERLRPIRNNFTLLNSPYKPLPKSERLERTEVTILPNGYAKIYVGDSKEGWCEALQYFLEILTKKEHEEIHTIKINYNSIRERGQKLHTFGGTASGHTSLQEMFEGFEKVLKNEIDPHLKPLENHPRKKGYVQARPIHILDMGNLIGANVVVGGVRRTAEIFLFDENDLECMFAKYGINGIWTEEQLKHHFKVSDLLAEKGIKPRWFDDIRQVGDGRFGLDHRRMSNNSVAFMEKPTREQLHLQFMLLQGEGEPCFVNLEEANKRRPNAEGLNPCAEILLDKKGVCNLTTINIMGFIEKKENGKYTLDTDGLVKAQRLSSRAGLRMTLVELELKGKNGKISWNEIQQRDRLTGTSVTGWKDAIALLGYSKEEESYLRRVLSKVARTEADKFAKQMRIPTPLLVTTVKPEGTLSQLANSILDSPVSSGLHSSHSPYYIRRIRINAHDPLAKVAIDLGWNVNVEVGTQGETEEEKFANAKTLVIDFPVRSGATKTKDDITVEEQFETYFDFQKNYTEHNSSNTITIKANEGEWEKAEQIVWDNWDDFVGVSFLALDGGTYQLAPYEKITKEEFEKKKADMRLFEPTLLQKYEKVETELDVGQESCESGACPIR